MKKLKLFLVGLSLITFSSFAFAMEENPINNNNLSQNSILLENDNFEKIELNDDAKRVVRRIIDENGKIEGWNKREQAKEELLKKVEEKVNKFLKEFSNSEDKKNNYTYEKNYIFKLKKCNIKPIILNLLLRQSKKNQYTLEMKFRYNLMYLKPELGFFKFPKTFIVNNNFFGDKYKIPDEEYKSATEEEDSDSFNDKVELQLKNGYVPNIKLSEKEKNEIKNLIIKSKRIGMFEQENAQKKLSYNIMRYLNEFIKEILQIEEDEDFNNKKYEVSFMLGDQNNRYPATYKLVFYATKKENKYFFDILIRDVNENNTFRLDERYFKIKY